MGTSPTKELKPAAVAVISKTLPSGWEASAVKADKVDVLCVGIGCFWGGELAFQRVPGVVKTEVGYTNGSDLGHPPSYEEVCSGTTGYVEAVRVEFDSSVVSYEELLQLFWSIHDPTQKGGQGGDIGTQYRSGIYYHSDLQKKLARESRMQLQATLDKDIATEISLASKWYPAEDYHQSYLQKGGQCAAKGDLSNIRCYG